MDKKVKNPKIRRKLDFKEDCVTEDVTESGDDVSGSDDTLILDGHNGNDCRRHEYKLRNLSKKTYCDKLSDCEDFSADESEYLPSSENARSSLNSSFGGDSPCINEIYEKISRTPSTVSNLSVVLNNIDFVATPTVVYKQNSGPCTPSHRQLNRNLLHSSTTTEGGRRDSTNPEHIEHINIIDISLKPNKYFSDDIYTESFRTGDVTLTTAELHKTEGLQSISFNFDNDVLDCTLTPSCMSTDMQNSANQNSTTMSQGNVEDVTLTIAGLPVAEEPQTFDDVILDLTVTTSRMYTDIQPENQNNLTMLHKNINKGKSENKNNTPTSHANNEIQKDNDEEDSINPIENIPCSVSSLSILCSGNVISTKAKVHEDEGQQNQTIDDDVLDLTITTLDMNKDIQPENQNNPTTSHEGIEIQSPENQNETSNSLENNGIPPENHNNPTTSQGNIEMQTPENKNTSTSHEDNNMHPENQNNPTTSHEGIEIQSPENQNETSNSLENNGIPPENQNNPTKSKENIEMQTPENKNMSTSHEDNNMHPENQNNPTTSQDSIEIQSPENQNDTSTSYENNGIQPENQNNPTTSQENIEMQNPENQHKGTSHDDNYIQPENQNNPTTSHESIEIQSPENQNNPSTSHASHEIQNADNEEDNQSTNKKKKLSRKRPRDEDDWEDRKNKILKISGKSYHGVRSKKNFQEKKIGDKCSCKKKCGDIFSTEKRQDFFDKYYALADHEKQWHFIAKYTTTDNVKRIQLIRKNNRTQSIKYYMPLDNNKIQVCKVFFINTLKISHQTVYTALEKYESDNSMTDKRGRHENRPRKMSISTEHSIMNHIELFPAIEAHYVRQNTAKNYLSEDLNISKMYRLYKDWFPKQTYSDDVKIATLRQYQTIFNTKYNYSFFKPKKDICGSCALYRQADSERKISLQETYDTHIKNKEAVRKVKEEEKKTADMSNTTIAIFDLEKVLNIPQSQVGIFHYKRKYPIYNFTVYDSLRKKGYCFVWHAQVAKRGSIEIGSCLWQFMIKEHERGIAHLSFYSDGCAGQNKNRFIFALYLYAAIKLKINVTHRFFETGHGQSEGDMRHKVIYTPDQMYTIITNAKVTGEKFEVKEMAQSDFYDIKALICGRNWLRDTKGHKVSWSKVMEVKVSYAEPNRLYYKYGLEEDYSVLNTAVSELQARQTRGRRTATVSTEAIETLQRAYSRPFSISKPLHDDLMSLCTSEAIPKHYHPFYESLTYVDNQETTHVQESSDSD